MSGLKCILHIDPVLGDQSVRNVSESTWSKVKIATTARQNRPNARLSKYWSISATLPDVYGDCDGYHSSCYSNYTAIRGNDASGMEVEETEKHHVFLRSESTISPAGSSGILPTVCIFCNKARKKKKGIELPLGSYEYDAPELNVKEAAQSLNDNDMLAKIGDTGFHSKEVKYHHECKREYFNKVRACSNNSTKDSESEIKMSAFDSLVSYIQSSVVDANRPEYLKSLHRRYCTHLNEASISTPSVRDFGERILQHFAGLVLLDKLSRKQGLVFIQQSVLKRKGPENGC